MKPHPVVLKTEHEANENPKIPTNHKDSADPLVQDQFDALTSLATPNMPGTNLNFDGIAFPGVSCNCAPPDTNGEVGATQYVQIVNEGFQVFNKTTGASQLGPIGISTIWSGFSGPCETAGSGDPVVLYDQLANRWLISQFAGVGIPTDECIAVSTTSDATGSYNRYAFHLGSNFFDYPKLAVWPDAYYMAMNVFNSSATSFLGPQPFAFDRARMLAGLPATFITTGITGGPNEATYLPGDLDGSIMPPAGSPASFIEWPGTGTFRVFHFHVDFANPLNSTFTLFANPAAAGFTQRITGVPQLGTTTLLDPLGDRLMFRAATRFFPDGHESLVSNYTVQSGGVAAVRWFELRNPTQGPVSVFQQGTYQPDATHRWMGSAAMDRQGNLAVGYSASSSAINPQIRYAGRLAGDPLNTLQAEATLFAGTGSQSGIDRWGDYSAMTIDPVDDCTFWYTQEYVGTNWRTRIGSFRFPGCLTRTLTVASTNPSSGASITVSPADINGSGSGTTQFSLTYNNNTQVSLGAPALAGGNNFQKWQRNGVDWSTNKLTSVVMDANYTMTAIYAPGPGGSVAAYDSTLKAPKCGPGNSCDSGTLLNGRGNISGGPEPNQPNTINNSCSDGSLGAYHVEESIDRIRVATTDGSTLAPDKLVTFEITYWAASTDLDFLDLYYLSDVSSTNWIYMTTLRPQATGLQVVSSIRQLAGTGNLQAVRAVLRSGGSIAPCTPGNVNDHDDLVFAAPAPPPTLMIESANPISGVNITVSPNDLNGLGNGATQFTRTYNYNTNVTLTAPATVNGNVFSRWRLNGFDLTSSLTASVAVVPFTTITAVYETPQRTLTVASTNPASGVNIAVSPVSNSGLGDGTTQFSRTYNQNTTVSLTAPATIGSSTFQKWQRNSADWSFSPETSVTLDANHTMTAVYVTPQQTLTVASTNPSSGVSITVSPNDNNGVGNGVTQFSRTYNQNTTVSLTAPATAGGNAFQKWQRNGVDWSVSQSTNVTLDASYTMTAVYVTQRTLTVASTNPSSGVSIAVSPNDNGGLGNGVTQFTRTYNQNTNVTLIAPASVGSNTFLKWQRNGVDVSFNQTTSVTMDANYTMTAVYVTPLRTLTVASTNPSSGVSITVTPNDNGGLGNGVTQFTRTYNQNTTVNLTAPATVGSNIFQKWQRNGVDWSVSQATNVTLDVNYTMTAVYAPNLTSGLVGYWKFDENSGTTAADSSGNGNTGALVSGAGWTSGQSGAAVSLDGVDDFVRIKDGKISTSTTGTISAWVKMNTLVNARKILSYGGAAAPDIQGLFALEIRQDGGNFFFSVINVPFDGSPIVNSVHGSTALQSGVWYHVALTSDGSSWKLYLNGVAETLTTQLGNGNTGKWFGNTSAAAPDKTYIGGARFNGTDTGSLNGAIDEVRIYDRALSASEVAALVGDTSNLGLVGYWKFDENSGTTAADSSGNGNTGALVSGAGWTSGQSGAAVSLDGVDDFVRIKDGKISTSTTGTISAWVKMNTLVNARKILSYGGAAAPDIQGLFALEIRQDGGNFFFSVINVPFDGSLIVNSVHGSTALQSGVWYHVALTSDGSSWKLYVNGVAETLTTQLGNGNTGKWFGNTSAATPDKTYIGGARFNGTDTGSLNGAIDEVRIYDRALSASEVAALVGDTSNLGLVGYWKFDENSGTTAADSSGNGNTGTLVSGAGWTSGQSGAAVSLDGVDDFVRIKDGKISTSTTGTISAWVKMNTLVNARKILSYGGAAAPDIQGLFALEIRQDGGNFFFSVINVPFDGSPIVNSAHGSTALQSGVWYHVALTSDGSSWKLYVNGVAETLTTQLGNGNTGKWFGNTSAAAPDKTYIGGARFNGTDTGNLNGVLDEVRIYDRALSASEITTLANGPGN